MEPGGPLPHSQGHPLIPVLSRINPILRIDTGLFKIHFNVVLPYMSRPSERALSCRLPVKILNVLLASSTWPAHLNLLDLITLTILDERYKLLSSSLWSLLHSVFSSLLGPNIRFRIQFFRSDKVAYSTFKLCDWSFLINQTKSIKQRKI